MENLLKRYTSECNLRPWMQEPFSCMDKTMSTNSHVALIAPKIDSYDDHSDRTKFLLDIPRNLYIQIKVYDIMNAINKVPLVDDYDIEIKECKDCEGTGEVDFIFIDSNCNEHIEEVICPVCDGEGDIEFKTPNGIKILDEDYTIKIKDSLISARWVEELLYIAEYLKADYVTLVSQESSMKPSILKIEEVEFLIMPFISSENIIEL